MVSLSTTRDASGLARRLMIGLDTSHVPAFAKLFNGPKATGDLAGIKIVAGYPGGTDFAPSKTRVEKFTADLKGMGIEIVDSIPKLLEKSDFISTTFAETETIGGCVSSIAYNFCILPTDRSISLTMILFERSSTSMLPLSLIKAFPLGAKSVALA